MLEEFKIGLKQKAVKTPGEVLKNLLEIFKKNIDEFNTVIVLSQEFEQINNLQLTSTEESTKINIQINSLVFRIVKLIDLITEKEALAYDLTQARFEKVLIICKTKDRETEIRNLLPKSRWKLSEIDSSGTPLSASEVNDYQLIVFDNSPFETKEEPLLQFYIDNTSPLIFYFGKYLDALSNYPTRIYFSNSIFSFQSRLMEMIDYLNLIRKTE